MMRIHTLLFHATVLAAVISTTTVITTFGQEKATDNSPKQFQSLESSEQAQEALPEKTVEEKSETAKTVQEEVDKTVAKETEAKRNRLVKEAVSAVGSTRKALSLLDEQKTDEALKVLKEAVGTLELAIARNPDLSFIPVMVSTQIHDLYAKAETVKMIVDEAQEALDDGKVQVARTLLDDLASELVVSTHEVPLATYPEAIKAAVPMIDEGKIEEAKAQLQTALNLIVIRTVVSPLPEIRTNAMMKEAEKLSKKKDRSAEENKRLTKLINGIEDQTKLGNALGYMDKKEADKIYDELDEIREKTSGGKSGKGFFDKFRGFFGW